MSRFAQVRPIISSGSLLSRARTDFLRWGGRHGVLQSSETTENRLACHPYLKAESRETGPHFLTAFLTWPMIRSKSLTPSSLCQALNHHAGLQPAPRPRPSGL